MATMADHHITIIMDIDDRHNRIRLAQESYLRQTEHLHNELSKIMCFSPYSIHFSKDGSHRKVYDELTQTRIDFIKHEIEKIYKESLGGSIVNAGNQSYIFSTSSTSSTSDIDEILESSRKEWAKRQIDHLKHSDEEHLRDIEKLIEVSREQKLAQLNPSFKEFIKFKISRLKL